MTEKQRLLIVDDVSENLNVLTHLLENADYEVMAAPSGKIALEILETVSVDLVLLDVLMPEMDGMETCEKILQQVASPPPIIFISASNDMQQLAAAFAAGGVDYITKPFNAIEVMARVKNQLEISRLQSLLLQRNAELEAQIRQRETAESALSVASDTLQHICKKEVERWGLKAFIGASREFQKIYAQIRQLQSFSQTNVLILGESGSGKELVARALHYGSDKCSKPFIAINCSAIAENIAEAEFFGNTKGAFTGATSDRKGFFELADGGTLFLDEVGDLPLSLQAKLLRALESGQFYPVGSKDMKTVNVRVISATNNNLEQKKQDKTFREDLYFRLAQFVVMLPALRERLEDIPDLARYFVQEFSSQMNIRAPLLSDGALRKLQGYHFPGNIRELKNIIERAIILSNKGAIDAWHIQIQQDTQTTAKLLKPGEEELSLRHVKKTLSELALQKTEGNVTKAAKLLGVHRSWFYRLEEK